MSSALAEAENTFLLSPTNDIRTCGELKARLAECLSERNSVSLDAAAFEVGDITFVQILISASKTAAGLGGSVTIVNGGPALTALLERCGCGADTLRLRSGEQ